MVLHLPNGALRASLTSRLFRPASPRATTLAAHRLGPPSTRTAHRTTTFSSLCPSGARALSHAPQCESRSRAPPRPAYRPGLRAYATASGPQLPKHIAVLGGGLTGLTTAYYLTRYHPDAKITLYEASDRLGGWVDTDHLQVRTQEGKEATVHFERGARVVSPQHTLGRWEDFVLYDLIEQLGLDGAPNGAYRIPKQSPVLSQRYLYYPDHVVLLPSPPKDKTVFSALSWALNTVYKIVTEPVFRGAASSLKSLYNKDAEMKWKWQQVSPSGVSPRFAIADHQDISTGAFLEGIFGRADLVNNVASALYHGVWGGDIWKLSATETTLQNFFFQMHHSGLGMTAVKEHDYDSGRDIFMRNPNIRRIAREHTAAGYVGFHNGFSTLTNALADALRSSGNVTIKTGTPIQSIQYDKDEGKAVITSSTTTESSKYDKVISSLYSGTLAELAGDALPTLKNSTAITIQIVNLWFPKPLITRPLQGFGYVIPQSVPAENNPHAALGVIFDSDREIAADSPEHKSVGGTKLTVMLGGHYWDYLAPENWPDAKEATAMALDTVQRQLGIPADEPVYTSTKICHQCIPQHLVGHRARMAKAHAELFESFRGTLAVVGGSYTSPGVLPSLKAARDIALKVAGKGYKNGETGMECNMTHVGETGLARFCGKKETFRLEYGRRLPFRYGNIGTSFRPKF